MTSVLVLLPVYNGALFLEQQVRSIMDQHGVHTDVLWRDDGSTDASVALLDQLALKWPGRIERVEDGRGKLGASGNFSCLMDAAAILRPASSGTDPLAYIALADQDDVWHLDKLRIGLDALQRIERGHPEKPALVHSDLRLISDAGAEIAPSMARYQGLQTHLDSLAAQTLSNTLTGCTCLMNRELLRAALPIPPEAIMHDWWLSMVASALGHRTYLDRALIDYRQHQSNAVGAKPKDENPREKRFLRRLQGFLDHRHRDIFAKNALQAGAFLRRYRQRLSVRQATVLRIATLLAIPLPPMQRLIYRGLRRL